LVRFGFSFLSLKPKKLKNNQAKPGKNRVKPEKIKSNLKNRVNQFEPVFVLKKPN
jgi:hypothetical protein